MDKADIRPYQGLTPEGIIKLERLKSELEQLNRTMEQMEGKSQFEIEESVRTFQEKEAEVRQFLSELGLMPKG